MSYAETCKFQRGGRRPGSGRKKAPFSYTWKAITKLLIILTTLLLTSYLARANDPHWYSHHIDPTIRAELSYIDTYLQNSESRFASLSGTPEQRLAELRAYQDQQLATFRANHDDLMNLLQKEHDRMLDELWDIGSEPLYIHTVQQDLLAGEDNLQKLELNLEHDLDEVMLREYQMLSKRL